MISDDDDVYICDINVISDDDVYYYNCQRLKLEGVKGRRRICAFGRRSGVA